MNSAQGVAATARDIQEIGAALGKVLSAGDVVILSGPLGAGKTTFTQGIAAGLNVRGPITSPTFVISRLHPSLADGPALLHVDAYRLESLAEVDDLDLDSDLESAVLVAEWGDGKLDSLVTDFLRIEIQRDDTEVRKLALSGVGKRWEDVDLNSVLGR